MRVRAEYRFDRESGNWSFRVPGLGVVGAADSREEAERAAIAAVAFALEDGNEVAEPADAEVRYLALTAQR